ncbi:MAG: DUF2817 domain-containing protein [Alkalicoccus sp.]|nr:MAG: DUF2817 domain-containing protein [Alkalicoccus sp.]
MNESSFFNNDYEQSRSSFRQLSRRIRTYYPEAVLDYWYTGPAADDNTTDIIEADALEEFKTLIVLSSGEHGIEGFAGNAVLEMFVKTFLPHLDKSTTGLTLVHGLNPWGMRHNRRVTESNIDLNRNYLDHFSNNSPVTHSIFENHLPLFRPATPVNDINTHNNELKSELRHIFSYEDLQMLKNTPPGQYKYSDSLYYGGKHLDEPAEKWTDYFISRAAGYEKVIHIDLHTGGGPENELTLIFMNGETRSAEELQSALSWKNVMKNTSADMLGDSVDYLQRIAQKKFTDKNIVSSLFEFGTIKESFEDCLFCTKTMLNENYLHFKGGSEEAAEKVSNDFIRLFNPASRSWKESVVTQAEQALKSLLTNEGVL